MNGIKYCKLPYVFKARVLAIITSKYHNDPDNGDAATTLRSVTDLTAGRQRSCASGIIAQLFSIVALCYWAGWWDFSLRFPLSSENLSFLRVVPSLSLPQARRERNEIWHKGSLGDEDGIKYCKLPYVLCPNFEYTHSAEKARIITLDDEK